MRNIMHKMQREAAERLPRPPGIIIPGWFWQEWFLMFVGAAIIAGLILLTLW